MKGDIFMLWDTHMHTHFSGDSNADPAAMARSAIEKNLAGICITDHLDYDYRMNRIYSPLIFLNMKKESVSCRLIFLIP